MSKLAEFREIERQLQELKQKHESLQNSEELKRDLQFADELNALVKEYGKTIEQVVQIIAPELLADKPAAPARRQRATKVYTNPHNGQVIETKGGNHKGLKEWKEQYGADVVESWAAVA